MRRILIICCLTVFWAGLAMGQAPDNGVLREVFLDVPGNQVSDLRNSDKFPDRPDEQTFYTDGFDMPVDIAENYGQRVRGYVVAPLTGNYIFEMAGDDGCELYLSSDDSPAEARLIASIPGWTARGEFGKYPEQRSDAIRLVSGRRYYIEALMKEQGGGDHLTVRWELPNGQTQTPIPNQSLEPYIPPPPGIASHPENQTVEEGQDAVFEIELSRATLVTMQWFWKGEAVEAADGTVLVLPSVRLEDDGSEVYAVVTLPDGSTIESESAQLNVVADTVPPELVSAVNLGDPNAISLVFSEQLERTSAEDISNYEISGGIVVREARLVGEGRTVFLVLSPLQAGVTYTATVSGIIDTSSQGNAMDSQSIEFPYDYTPLNRGEITGAPEAIGPSTRITGLIISEFSYHPSDTGDGRSLEFIELFNTEEWEVDLSGHRISGEIEYVFPSGTTIGRRGYLTIAADPEALQDHYGITGVIGPWDGALANDGGTIRLTNRIDALLQEIEYLDRHPWPAAADGTGHSLVMARPSYGENNPTAWRASDETGGNPGGPDAFSSHPLENVVINEIFCNSPDPEVDFIELHNLAASAVDIGGCIVTDRAGEDRYVIPEGTTIAPRGFFTIDESQLGFAFNSEGESVFLFNPERDRVVDAFQFLGQPVGVSIGRRPDGAEDWTQLAEPTPSNANSQSRISDIVISEIHYNPLSRLDDHEFLELFNRSSEAVDLGGWKIQGDISYTFAPGSVIAAGGYVVLCENRESILQRYPELDESAVFGNYSGNLSDSDGRLRLMKPEIRLVDGAGTTPVEERFDVLEDELHFLDGGMWPDLADGDGSSLELIHPDLDNALASSWAASREAHKTEWKTYSWTGRLDNGTDSANEIQIILLGGGECLVDDIRVTQGNSVNRVPNPGFENGLDEWVIQGNHIQSRLSEPGEGSEGEYALHLIASSGGDNGVNRIESDLTQPLAINQQATISARLKWINGHPDILFRTYGNYGELSARMDTPAKPGTPGQANSVAAPNSGPLITDVSHHPVFPGGGEPVTIRARILDNDRLSRVMLNYRLHPSTNHVAVPMSYRGAGFFSASIPAQPSGRSVGFRIEASDAHEQSMATHFPGTTMLQEGIIRFGESRPDGTFGDYHVWVGPENLREWESRARLSNELLPVTFVSGEDRVIYTAEGRYRGSPFIRPGYGSPANAAAMGMIYRFPADQPFLGTDKVNLDGLEPGRDDTSQRERTSFWIGDQLDVSYSYQRYMRLYVNGTRKSDVYSDSMQPDSEYIERWYPGEDEGELFKIDDWFEFSDGPNPGRTFSRNARLTPFLTEGDVLKKTAYRWMWEKKPNGGLDDDYGRLLDLVTALNTQGSTYTGSVEQLVDIEQWMRVFATRHIVGDWDGYGYNRGKNMSAFKPVNGRWKMLLWDLDFSLGGGSDGPNTSMYNVEDPTIGRFYNHPPFQRAYLRAWQDAVDGPLSSLSVRNETTAVYNGLRRNGINAASPTALQSWIASRRSYLVSQLQPHQAPLAITTNSGNNFNSDDNLAELAGTAPVKIRTLLFNGNPIPVRWISATSWRAAVPLGPGVNEITLTGLDSAGNLMDGVSTSIRINYTGEMADPAEFLAINEIQYNPLTPGTAFVEIVNRSADHAFDLSGMEINGLGYTFPPGSSIQPSAFLVLAADAATLASVVGPTIPIFDQFPGNLDNGGETLTLLKPSGAEGVEPVIIDQVRYDDSFPWPLVSDGQGPSLQLIDPALDNRRAANWFAATADGPVGSTNNVVELDSVWQFNQSGNDLGTEWRAPEYDDSGWESGRGLLYVENAPLPGPKNTELTRGPLTFYFRTEFEIGSPAAATHFFSTVLDDGAVIYINGVEVARPGMPAGTIDSSTPATRTVTDASLEGPFPIPANVLRQGTNVVAVEVHQTNATSSDVVWGMTIERRVAGARSSSPGQPNTGAPDDPQLPPLWLNEIYLGAATPSWVEIHNSSDSEQSMASLYLSDDPQEPMKYALPDSASIEGGGFGLTAFGTAPAGLPGTVWVAPFELDPSTRPTLVLSRVSGESVVIVDTINLASTPPGRSYGSFPDGDPINRVIMTMETPMESNSISSPEVEVFFSEWMALNETGFTDPADGLFEDWFELFNAGTETVDLSGFLLSDDPQQPGRFVIPQGVVIGPRSYLLVIADSQPEQYQPGGLIHTNFRLSSTGGESLLLSNPAGLLIDRVDFGPQVADVSEGRLQPVISAEPVTLPRSTPGEPNDGTQEPENPLLSISTSVTPGTFLISWESRTGTTYHLQATHSLTDPQWETVETLPGDGSTLSVTVSVEDAEARFFLLRLSE